MARNTAMLIAVSTFALAGWSLPAGAQTTDVFSLNYFDNVPQEEAVALDSTVRVTNPGTNGAPTLANPTGGDLCAMIYVFHPDQQLAECCGCLVSPNGLLTLSVRSDLTSNPLTSDSLDRGVIKIVSSTGTSSTDSKGMTRIKCDATTVTPTPTLLAWGTHVQAAGALTETAFERAPLSADEMTTVTEKCGDIHDNGSGHGICSCGAERLAP